MVIIASAVTHSIKREENGANVAHTVATADRCRFNQAAQRHQLSAHHLHERLSARRAHCIGHTSAAARASRAYDVFALGKRVSFVPPASKRRRQIRAPVHIRQWRRARIATTTAAHDGLPGARNFGAVGRDQSFLSPKCRQFRFYNEFSKFSVVSIVSNI